MIRSAPSRQLLGADLSRTLSQRAVWSYRSQDSFSVILPRSIKSVRRTHVSTPPRVCECGLRGGVSCGNAISARRSSPFCTLAGDVRTFDAAHGESQKFEVALSRHGASQGQFASRIVTLQNGAVLCPLAPPVMQGDACFQQSHQT